MRRLQLLQAMRAILLAITALAGCATTTDDGYDLTLHGDSKADEIGGLKVRWELGERHDLLSKPDRELGVTVALRGGTLMLLEADVAEVRPVSDDGTVHYMPGSVVTLGIESDEANVELAFALADGAQLAEGKLVPMSCGGTQMFKTLALDFANGQLIVDGDTPHSFESCGITLDPKDPGAFRASSFALLGVPVRTLDGSRFAGVYTYRHVVTVR